MAIEKLHLAYDLSLTCQQGRWILHHSCLPKMVFGKPS
jgi:hypothetical protein